MPPSVEGKTATLNYWLDRPQNRLFPVQESLVIGQRNRQVIRRRNAIFGSLAVTETDCQEFKQYFEFLKDDFFTLKVEWRVYRSLFGTNPETVDMLNRISGPTAFILDHVLFERILLTLRKLTDNPYDKRGRLVSVSVRGLEYWPDARTDKLEALVDLAKSNSEFARNWSNKRVAHSDLEVKKKSKQLLPASRMAVEEAIKSIGDVLFAVASDRFNTHLVLNPVPALKDERRFLRVLHHGLEYLDDLDEQRRQAYSEGDWEKLDQLRDESKTYPEWLRRDEPPFE